jgi:hypothetical protein
VTPFRERVAHPSWTGWRGPAGEHDDHPPPTTDGRLWPYGPPEAHEDTCRLFDGHAGCDCNASVAEDP